MTGEKVAYFQHRGERSVKHHGVTEQRTPVRVSFMIDRLSRAGTEMQLLALIRGLDRRRVQPSLVLLDGADDLSRALEPEDCTVLRLGLPRLWSRQALRAARLLRTFWQEQRPDIVQFYFLDAAHFGIPVARWSGIRRIVRVQNNLGYWRREQRDWRVLWWDRFIRRGVDVVITNSQAGRDALIQDGYRPEQVQVMENGVDTERFRGFLLPDTTKRRVRVGCVANLRAVKNIDGLMRVARKLTDRYPQLVFEVAGEGEQRAELERLHAELELGERFVLRGRVEDVAGFLQGVEIAVLPSHSEGMSNALLEYMAAGRAIVATDVGANATVLRHRKDGLIVPAGDLAAMASAIEELLRFPLRAAGYGASARKRVESTYSRTAMLRRFEDFYENLCSHPPHDDNLHLQERTLKRAA
ncbi:MAG: glycosyltransferase [Thermogemmata sp.]|jgi:glycosyltransferase involved in cell wall biosynthesis